MSKEIHNFKKGDRVKVEAQGYWYHGEEGELAHCSGGKFAKVALDSRDGTITIPVDRLRPLGGGRAIKPGDYVRLNGKGRAYYKGEGERGQAGRVWIVASVNPGGVTTKGGAVFRPACVELALGPDSAPDVRGIDDLVRDLDRHGSPAIDVFNDMGQRVGTFVHPDEWDRLRNPLVGYEPCAVTPPALVDMPALAKQQAIYNKQAADRAREREAFLGRAIVPLHLPKTGAVASDFPSPFPPFGG